MSHGFIKVISHGPTKKLTLSQHSDCIGIFSDFILVYLPSIPLSEYCKVGPIFFFKASLILAGREEKALWYWNAKKTGNETEEQEIPIAVSKKKTFLDPEHICERDL